MRAGLLRQQLELQAATRTPNGRGGSTVTWTSLGTTWGRLVPLEGREAEVGPRLAAGVTHEGAVRSSARTRQLTPAHRIRWQSRTFEIVSVTDVDARRRELRIFVKEVAA